MTRSCSAALLLAAILASSASTSLANPFQPDQIESLLLSVHSAQLPVKCATPLLNAAQASRAELTLAGRQALDALLAPAALDQVYLSAGGHFQILYSIAGSDSIPVTDADASGTPDYVEWVAEAMEQSWQSEIVDLGFMPIPLGPGERYVVKMFESPSIYGSTVSSADPGGSFIKIQPRFDVFYQNFPWLVADDPDGAIRGGIRVTAAHEFKHAIQLVRSQWTEGGWLELDATFMEDVVFDQVNDYYNYLGLQGSPFTSPTTPLSSASYEDSTWEHYLRERWGWPVVRAFWVRRGQVLSSEQPQRTYQVVHGQQGIDWLESWGIYQAWNYASGSRATAGFGFFEAASFPTPPVVVIPSSSDYNSASFTSSGLTGRYHEMNNSSRVRRGEATLRFDGAPAVPWAAGILLQRTDRTRWFPAMFSAGVGSVTTTQVGVENFDRIAVIVGNGATGGAGGSYTFHLTTTGQVVSNAPTTMGSFKSLFKSTRQ